MRTPYRRTVIFNDEAVTGGVQSLRFLRRNLTGLFPLLTMF